MTLAFQTPEAANLLTKLNIDETLVLPQQNNMYKHCPCSARSFFFLAPAARNFSVGDTPKNGLAQR